MGVARLWLQGHRNGAWGKQKKRAGSVGLNPKACELRHPMSNVTLTMDQDVKLAVVKSFFSSLDSQHAKDEEVGVGAW